MILTSPSLVQCAKSCTGCSHSHGFTANHATAPRRRQIPSNEYKDDIQAMIDDYTNKEIVQELLQRVSRPPKEAWKDAYKFGASGDSLEPGVRRH
jgi:wyosine [tRNA(Phe)-imidazoG37] synthetase (radical SAM superfamily)